MLQGSGCWWPHRAATAHRPWGRAPSALVVHTGACACGSNVCASGLRKMRQQRVCTGPAANVPATCVHRRLVPPCRAIAIAVQDRVHCMTACCCLGCAGAGTHRGEVRARVPAGAPRRQRQAGRGRAGRRERRQVGSTVRRCLVSHSAHSACRRAVIHATLPVLATVPTPTTHHPILARALSLSLSLALYATPRTADVPLASAACAPRGEARCTAGTALTPS